MPNYRHHPKHMCEQFPERLHRLRTQQRKSCRAVSELSGLPHDAVRRYESGEATPSLPALIALADYFGVSLDYLAGRKISKNAP